MKYVLAAVLGVLLGIGITYAVIVRKAEAAMDQAAATIADQKQDLSDQDDKMEEMQARLDFFATASKRLLGDPQGKQGSGSLLDPSCRHDCGNNDSIPSEFRTSTLLWEKGQVAPRWIVAGKARIAVAGDAQSASYLYFENGFWSGPFHPQQLH